MINRRYECSENAQNEAKKKRWRWQVLLCDRRGKSGEIDWSYNANDWNVIKRSHHYFICYNPNDFTTFLQYSLMFRHLHWKACVSSYTQKRLSGIDIEKNANFCAAVALYFSRQHLYKQNVKNSAESTCIVLSYIVANTQRNSS